jgi:hypothetical protein
MRVLEVGTGRPCVQEPPLCRVWGVMMEVLGQCAFRSVLEFVTEH